MCAHYQEKVKRDEKMGRRESRDHLLLGCRGGRGREEGSGGERAERPCKRISAAAAFLFFSVARESGQDMKRLSAVCACVKGASFKHCTQALHASFRHTLSAFNGSWIQMGVACARQLCCQAWYLCVRSFKHSTAAVSIGRASYTCRHLMPHFRHLMPHLVPEMQKV